MFLYKIDPPLKFYFDANCSLFFEMGPFLAVLLFKLFYYFTVLKIFSSLPLDIWGLTYIFMSHILGLLHSCCFKGGHSHKLQGLVLPMMSSDCRISFLVVQRSKVFWPVKSEEPIYSGYVPFHSAFLRFWYLGCGPYLLFSRIRSSALME